MSISQKGKHSYPHSKEHIEKTAAGNRGKKRTAEQRKRISNSLKGIKRSKEYINSISKQWIIIFPNGKQKTITNLNEFCKNNNLHISAMSQVAKGNRKHHKQFKCLYG